MVHVFIQDRLPYDVKMTSSCGQPNHSFSFSLLFGVRIENWHKSQVSQKIGRVVRVGSGIVLWWN